MVKRVVLMVLVTVSCTRTPEPPQKVVLGVSLLRISLPVFVALDEGLFTQRGLQVETQTFDTAQPLADELAAGRLDAAGFVAFPILFGRQGPAPKVRVVGAIVEDSKHPISYLLVKKGSPLHSVAALKGKTVGILPTIAYRKWLEAIVAHDGLAPGDVTITPIAPALQVDTLANGGVDALFTGDPMATVALARGVAEPATETPDVPRVLGDPFVFGTFAVSETLATGRPEVAAKVREAIDEAIARISADQSIGRRALGSRLRETERAFADRYPDARYLSSKQLTQDQLAHTLSLIGTTAQAKDLLLP